MLAVFMNSESMYFCIETVKITSDADQSIWPDGQVVGAVTQQQHQAEHPNEVDGHSQESVALQMAVGLLVNPIMKNHQAGGVDV